jgi:hypothetical protein
MAQDQGNQGSILLSALPLMPLDFFFDLDHLPTARAAPVLLSQDHSTKRRRRTQRPPRVAGTEVHLPVRIERVGCALDLEGALGLAALPYSEDLLAGGRIGAAPPLPRLVGTGAVGEPAPGLIWVAVLGPAKQPPPPEVVQPEGGLATDGVANGLRLKHHCLVTQHQSHPRHIGWSLTVTQLAQRRGLSVHWLYDRIHNGQIRIHKDPATHLFLFPDHPTTLELLT